MDKRLVKSAGVLAAFDLVLKNVLTDLLKLQYKVIKKIHLKQQGFGVMVGYTEL